ncbi:MAG: toll/interleukin-1 receptor domain-containing protein [Gammaproteobacteria bacterium]|nr:toll/interleukin-1 receptor domain-containing protein [Gammaproteobacteria bacterium]
MNQPDVFVSYSSKDSEFVRTLVEWLEEAALDVWFAEEDMRAAADVEDELIENVDRCRHTIFVVSEHWLNSEWTKFERSVAMENCPADRRIIVVARMEISTPVRTLGRELHRKKRISWLEDEAEPEARFWEVCCGLGLAELGKKKDWVENGRKIRGATGVETVVQHSQAKDSLGQADVDTVLTCNRDTQWGKLHRLATDDQHEAVLIPGPACEAHELFLKRVEVCLPRDPDRRICDVRWPGCPPQSRAMAESEIAKAIDCQPDQLVRSLQSILSQKNLVLVHRPPFEETDCRAMIEYYSEWLPDLLDRVDIPGTSLPGKLKTVHAVSWPRVRALECGLSLLFSSSRKCDKVSAAREIEKRLDERFGQLRVRFLSELKPITEKDVRSWADSLDIDEDSRTRLVDHALDGDDSLEILKRISERLGHQRLSL